MNLDERPVGEDDLMAWVDGRLTADRVSVVERYLDANVAVRNRLVADREIAETIRQRLAPIAAAPLPARLRIDTITANRRQAMRNRLGMAAACLCLVTVSATGGWIARGTITPAKPAVQTVAASDAIAAHRVFVAEVAHPVEVDAAREAHLVQWLSRRVGRSLAVPDLTPFGYTLMGGRILPAGEAVAAQFMFENADHRRLTVFVRSTETADTGFQFGAVGGVKAFSWVEAGLGFVIVAETDRGRLLEEAEAVYRQLDPLHRPVPGVL